MVWKRVGIFACGVAASAIAAGIAKTESFRNTLVKCTAGAFKVGDKVTGFTQSVIDEASDVSAEARRQAKIDAAVAERLSELEEGVRAEVTKKVDAEAAKEAKAKK